MLGETRSMWGGGCWTRVYPAGRIEGDQTRFMDAVKGDMLVVGMTQEDAEDQERWRTVIRCSDP